MSEHDQQPAGHAPGSARRRTPRARQAPLPWQTPKSVDEDPLAHARVQAILDSPSYRQADDDVEFLDSHAARGARLELDYLKAETLLEAHGVRHTIVVFGSTRIPEPEAARRRVEILRDARARAPADAELERRLAIAERLHAKSRYYDVAREFGRRVGRCVALGHSHIVLMTGGGPGMMEAANRGAFDAGAKTIGLNIDLPHEQYPNPYISPELCFRFHYFGIRKLHFLLRAKALVVFPGGYGTFDELFETLTLVQTRKIEALPIVLVGEAFWRRVFDVDFMIAEGVIDPEDRHLFWYAESAAEIWDGILEWHVANGEPLISEPDPGRGG